MSTFKVVWPICVAAALAVLLVVGILWLMGLQVGLLINFHEKMLRDGIKRIVNDYRE